MSNTSELETFLDLGRKIAVEVSSRLRPAMDGREPLVVKEKSPGNLVTNLDEWAEDFSIKTINEALPDHVILGEESVARGIEPNSEEFASRFCWVIDPIDGTSNFVNKIPHVAVSLALLDRGQRVLGIVQDVTRDLTYWAIKGQGAWCDSKAISCSPEGKLFKSIFATGYPYKREKEWPELKAAYQKFYELTRDMRTFGAAALDQCWVANGSIQAFFEMGLGPWDVAAGSLIVEEAGGSCANPLSALLTDRDNSFEKFSLVDSGGFSCFSQSFLFCGNRQLHEHICTVLKGSAP